MNSLTTKNPVTHFEMPYEDAQRVETFYQSVFGWKITNLGSEMNNYIHAETTEMTHGLPAMVGAIHGGFFPKRPDRPAQVPSVVIGTGDIAASMRAVAEAGGEVLGEPMRIPGVGLYVSFLDSEGNRVSLLEPDADTSPTLADLTPDLLDASKAKVRTCLWFAKGGEEAARFYVSLLPGSRIDAVLRPDPEGEALLVDFTLAGSPYQALNANTDIRFTAASSISIKTEDQAETDRLWAALTTDGGEPGQCGWLKDRFGLSWQIVPESMLAMFASEDRRAAGRAMEAMMTMSKIDIAAVEAAFRG